LKKNIGGKKSSYNAITIAITKKNKAFKYFSKKKRKKRVKK